MSRCEETWQGDDNESEVIVVKEDGKVQDVYTEANSTFVELTDGEIVWRVGGNPLFVHATDTRRAFHLLLSAEYLCTDGLAYKRVAPLTEALTAEKVSEWLNASIDAGNGIDTCGIVAWDGDVEWNSTPLGVYLDTLPHGSSRFSLIRADTNEKPFLVAVVGAGMNGMMAAVRVPDALALWCELLAESRDESETGECVSWEWSSHYLDRAINRFEPESS